MIFTRVFCWVFIGFFYAPASWGYPGLQRLRGSGVEKGWFTWSRLVFVKETSKNHSKLEKKKPKKRKKEKYEKKLISLITKHHDIEVFFPTQQTMFCLLKENSTHSMTSLLSTPDGWTQVPLQRGGHVMGAGALFEASVKGVIDLDWGF